MLDILRLNAVKAPMMPEFAELRWRRRLFQPLKIHFYEKWSKKRIDCILFSVGIDLFLLHTRFGPTFSKGWVEQNTVATLLAPPLEKVDF